MFGYDNILYKVCAAFFWDVNSVNISNNTKKGKVFEGEEG